MNLHSASLGTSGILIPALFLETLGAWLLISGRAAWPAAVFLNTAAALIPALGGYLKHRAGHSPCRLALAAIFTLTMPGVGLYGFTLALLLSGTIFQHKGLAHEPDPDLPSASSFGLEEGPLGDDLGVEPIIDILRENDSPLKRGAIQVLQKLRTPESVSLLRTCLSDPDPEIRFYAHTALTQMEEYFIEAMSSVNESPRNTAWKQEQTAGLLLKYVHMGLPEGSMRRESLIRARTLLESALGRTQNKASMHLDLAELCLDLGDRKAAASYLEFPIEIEPTRTLALKSRLLYENRDFSGLAALYPDENAMQNTTTRFWNDNIPYGADHA